MPKVVDETKSEFTSNIKPGLAGAGAFGLGSMFLGPGLGLPIGGTIAGAYIGGTAGTILTVTGMSLGLASLIFGPIFGGVAGGTTATTSGGQQGVK